MPKEPVLQFFVWEGPLHTEEGWFWCQTLLLAQDEDHALAQSKHEVITFGTERQQGPFPSAVDARRGRELTDAERAERRASRDVMTHREPDLRLMNVRPVTVYEALAALVP